MHVSAAMYLRHPDKQGYLQNAINVGHDLSVRGERFLTGILRLGTGVRFFARCLETLFTDATPCSVANSGLRDSDNLWFDGLTACQVSDKVRTCAPIPSSVA